MPYPRLPRFTRRPPKRPITLTDRDREIIQLVHRHRFLRSIHLPGLIGGSTQQLLRRLQFLYHSGYLERPRAQIDYYTKGGSRPIVYGLGNKAASLLTSENQIPRYKRRWGERNRSAGRVFLEHALLVSDVLVSIEMACQRSAVARFLSEDDLQRQIPGFTSFRWQVKIKGGLKLGVVPDRVFALELGPPSSTDRAYFFLEADRGTMPITRKKLAQTSFFRKLLAYEATWKQSIHTARFGFHRFRVFTVTKSEVRLFGIKTAAASLEHGRGLFVFSTEERLSSPTEVLKTLLN